MILLHGASQIATPISDGTFRIFQNSAIVADGDRILFLGAETEAFAKFPETEKMDVTGKTILPGFVDSHTHLIFAGDRSHEFAARLRGATYQEIAASGGGIQFTVQATRAASERGLIDTAWNNLQRMVEYGTTTVEVKSGYGLNWESEKKILTVANSLRENSPLDVVVTFLGAHDFPRDLKQEEYIHQILEEMLPAVVKQGLAEFCDVFCDQGYYSVDQARRICLRAKQVGLKIKLHVDELADVNGAALAAELDAISADHLILANQEGIEKMARANVTAVLLPGTSFALKVKQHAPARAMIDAGVRVALATDFNPGTCFSHSMQLILQLAVLLYGITPEEALTGATLNGAAAIGREHEVGSLEAGKLMDCLIFDIPHYGYLFYNLGVNRLQTVLKRGKVIWSRNQN
jgi:imidazolonepropionase